MVLGDLFDAFPVDNVNLLLLLFNKLAMSLSSRTHKLTLLHRFVQLTMRAAHNGASVAGLAFSSPRRRVNLKDLLDLILERLVEDLFTQLGLEHGMSLLRLATVNRLSILLLLILPTRFA